MFFNVFFYFSITYVIVFVTPSTFLSSSRRVFSSAMFLAPMNATMSCLPLIS